jgi:hypothetical protein
MTAGREDQTAGDAVALGDRKDHVFECCQAAEQRRDLEGAGEATLDARGLWQIGDIRAVDDDLPGARREAAGHKLDKGGLSGAVRTNQRLPGAMFETEIDVVGDGQRAKALAQTASFERQSIARRQRFDAHRRSRSASPRMPPRANTTTIIIIKPSQKYQ